MLALKSERDGAVRVALELTDGVEHELGRRAGFSLSGMGTPNSAGKKRLFSSSRADAPSTPAEANERAGVDGASGERRSRRSTMLSMHVLAWWMVMIIINVQNSGGQFSRG